MRRDTERRLQGGQRRTLAATESGGYSDGEGGGPWRRRGAVALLSMKGNFQIT
jgi:hypothetical protein